MTLLNRGRDKNKQHIYLWQQHLVQMLLNHFYSLQLVKAMSMLPSNCNTSLNQQSFTVKTSAALTIIMFIAGLINSESTGQIFYQYCICIYVKAIHHLSQMPRVYKNSTINQQFLESKRLYESYALHALKNLNFLGNPTLPFIQSLISAVCFQYLLKKGPSLIINYV